MSQQIGYQKAYKHLQEVSKINNTTQGKGKKLPFINPREIKTLQQKEKKEGKVKERKKRLPSSSLSFICNLSPSSSTES